MKTLIRWIRYFLSSVEYNQVTCLLVLLLLANELDSNFMLWTIRISFGLVLIQAALSVAASHYRWKIEQRSWPPPQTDEVA